MPVVSVGNISMGGTGKTPLSAYLLKWAARQGHRPVLLSRGYKSAPDKYPHPVHPGDHPGISGDEPILLARSSPRARVIVDPHRVRAAAWALERLSPTLFILDDGFQHLRIQRDLNLVLLTEHDLGFGWDRPFPAGGWREGRQALKRADAFLINLQGRELTSRIQGMAQERLQEFNKKIIFFDIQTHKLNQLGSGSRVRDIDNRPYVLVTSVAGASKILSSAYDFLGYPPEKHLAYPDHHPLGERAIQDTIYWTRRHQVKDVVCTTKDAVKLRPVPELNIWVMEPEPVFWEGGETELQNYLSHCLG